MNTKTVWFEQTVRNKDQSMLGKTRVPVTVQAEPLPWEQAVAAAELGARVVCVWQRDLAIRYFSRSDYEDGPRPVHHSICGYTYHLEMS